MLVVVVTIADVLNTFGDRSSLQVQDQLSSGPIRPSRPGLAPWLGAGTRWNSCAAAHVHALQWTLECLSLLLVSHSRVLLCAEHAHAAGWESSLAAHPLPLLALLPIGINQRIAHERLFVRVLRVFPANPEGAVRVLTAAANPSIPDARGPMLPRRRVSMAWVGDRGAGCWPRSSAPQAGLEAANIVDGADERARGLVSSTSRPMVGNIGA